MDRCAGRFRWPGGLRRRRRTGLPVLTEPCQGAGWRVIGTKGLTRRLGIDDRRPKPRRGLLRWGCRGWGQSGLDLPPGPAWRLAAQGGRKACRPLGGVAGGCRLTRSCAGDLFTQLLDFCRCGGLLLTRRWRCPPRGRTCLHLTAVRPNIFIDGLADRSQKIFHARFCSHDTHPVGDNRPILPKGLRESGGLVDMLGARFTPASPAFRTPALVDSLHVRTDPLVAHAAVVLLGIIDRHLELQVLGRQAADRCHELVSGNDARGLCVDLQHL